MFRETTPLSYPVMAAIVSAFCWVVALRLPERFIFLRLMFQALGLIFAVVTLVTGWDYFFPRLIDYLARIREAWYAPGLRYAEVIASMNIKQLDLMEAGGVMRIRPGGKVEGRLHWLVATPELDLPLSWIYEYLDGCEESFPDFLPQHGLSDNLERHRRRAFTKMMTNSSWGIAEWAAGNQAAHWLLPNMSAVRDALGMQ